MNYSAHAGLYSAVLPTYAFPVQTNYMLSIDVHGTMQFLIITKLVTSSGKMAT